MATTTSCPNCGAVLSAEEGQQSACPYCKAAQQTQTQSTAAAPAPETRYVRRLQTNRSLLKYILLSIVTFGIYSIIFWYTASDDINEMASRYDGKKTMNYALLFFLVGPVTFGVAYFVWIHRISNRIGGELNRRRIPYSVDASTFWLWGILGAFIIVGPFIYLHKMATAMNLLAENYNLNGN